MKKSPAQVTVANHLIRRLGQAGVRHVFSVPGDYVLGFCDAVLASPLELVGTCTEQGAAFAADAYARVNGLGAVCVTYAVGGFNTLNAVAGAYAEKSPVVVISGAPGMNERVRSPLLHHRVKDFRTQREVFEKVTAMAVAIEDPASAPDLIDRAIACALATKRPVYIELPRDMASKPCHPTVSTKPAPSGADPAVLDEALGEAVARLKAAKRPAILAGVEVHRFGLQDHLTRLLKRSGAPVAATLLGKSVVSELHPQYAGVYEGAIGREEVRRVIEDSDCLLILGAFMTDLNLGGFSARLDPAHTINANSERIQISRHAYEGVDLGGFIDGLTRRWPGPARKVAKPPAKAKPPARTARDRARPLTVSRFFQMVNGFIQDDMIIICDVGDSLFGGADLTIHRRTEFLSPAYYASMGFAIPAALGAQTGRASLRPVVFVGDGAFQMSASELSTIARQGLNPIVFVLNNKGYSTERAIHDGPYNNLRDWSYHHFTRLIDAGWGTEVETEGGLEIAMHLALNNARSLSIINVHLDPADRSDALARLGARIARQGGMKTPKPAADRLKKGGTAKKRK